MYIFSEKFRVDKLHCGVYKIVVSVVGKCLRNSGSLISKTGPNSLRLRVRATGLEERLSRGASNLPAPYPQYYFATLSQNGQLYKYQREWKIWTIYYGLLSDQWQRHLKEYCQRALQAWGWFSLINATVCVALCIMHSVNLLQGLCALMWGGAGWKEEFEGWRTIYKGNSMLLTAVQYLEGTPTTISETPGTKEPWLARPESLHLRELTKKHYIIYACGETIK